MRPSCGTHFHKLHISFWLFCSNKLKWRTDWLNCHKLTSMAFSWFRMDVLIRMCGACHTDLTTRPVHQIAWIYHKPENWNLLGGFLCSWEDILCTLSARFAFMDVQSILKEKEPSLNPVQSFYHTPASVNPVQAWNFQHIVWSSSTSLELQARLCGVDDGVEARQGLHVQDLGATCHTEERPFLFWCRDDPSQKDFAVASTCVADCAVWFGHL